MSKAKSQKPDPIGDIEMQPEIPEDSFKKMGGLKRVGTSKYEKTANESNVNPDTNEHVFWVSF